MNIIFYINRGQSDLVLAAKRPKKQDLYATASSKQLTAIHNAHAVAASLSKPWPHTISFQENQS